MKMIRIIAATMGVTALTLACVAQEEDEGPIAFTYATYYYCDGGPLSRADEVMAEDAERINGFVEDATLSSWGYSTHVVGGRFRALQTMTAPDMQSLMAGRGKVIEAVYAEDSEAGEEFSRICGPHVDYMWNIGIEK